MLRLDLRTLGVLAAGAIAAALWSGIAGADESHPDATVLREEEVLAHWLKSSPENAFWRAQIGSARFDVIAAKVWPNPELTLGFQGAAMGEPINGATGYSAQVSAPLPVFGQIGARRDAAEALVNVAETTVLNSLWLRAADIQAAMVARAFSDGRLVMLQRNLQELDRIEKIVALRTSAGATGEYDMLRVTTSTATLRAAVNTAIVERDRAEANIVALVADPTFTAAPLTRDGLILFRGPESEAGLIAVALKRRPDLELARRGVIANQRAATRFRRDAIPTPSIFVGGAKSFGPESVYVNGGVSFPLPVFDRNQGQIGRALSDAQGQQFLVAALEARARAEVSGSWRARQNARAGLAQFRDKSLIAATELLKRAEVTYQAGKFSITELFDAYQTMWDARSQELDLERQMADAEADLERAAVLGTLLP